MDAKDFQYKYNKATLPTWHDFQEGTEIRVKPDLGITVLEDVSEQIWKGSDLQMRFTDDKKWLNLADDVEYRIKPKTNLDADIEADIEALYVKAKELGIKLTILIE
jgi:hypothetical protein